MCEVEGSGLGEGSGDAQLTENLQSGFPRGVLLHHGCGLVRGLPYGVFLVILEDYKSGSLQHHQAAEEDRQRSAEPSDPLLRPTIPMRLQNEQFGGRGFGQLLQAFGCGIVLGGFPLPVSLRMSGILDMGKPHLCSSNTFLIGTAAAASFSPVLFSRLGINGMVPPHLYSNFILEIRKSAAPTVFPEPAHSETCQLSRAMRPVVPNTIREDRIKADRAGQAPATMLP